MDNYYDILGVSADSSPDEIKKAYRKLVSQKHPDKFASEGEDRVKQASEEFKKIQEAYEILSDDQKKSNYDARRNGWNEDIFASTMARDFFSQGPFSQFMREAQRPVPPGVLIAVSLTAAECFSEQTKKIDYEYFKPCSDCNGNGGFDFTTCSYCNGTGQTQQVQQFANGMHIRQEVCRACHGTGKSIGRVCQPCNGLGRINQKATLEAVIPPGSVGQTKKIDGQGNDIGNRIPRGPVMLEIRLEDPIFGLVDPSRGDIGMNLLADPVEVMLKKNKKFNGVLGNELSVGLVPACLQGAVFKVPGEGIPNFAGQRGTLHVKVRLGHGEISEEQREMLEKYLTVS